MRAVQHSEQRVELQLDTLVVLPEQQREQQSSSYPA
ncbi:hypothetical protein EDF19_1054 [Curtobacterium sp. PhB115]|nr:hypothetical protein EDF19_1054 [Curtobacterium sp. PhB115]